MDLIRNVVPWVQGPNINQLEILKSSIATALSGYTYQYWFADDPLSMFQDTSATIPAVSATDTVRAIKMLGSSGDYIYSAIDATSGALESAGNKLSYRASGARLRASTSGWSTAGSTATVWFIYEADDQASVTTQDEGNYLMHWTGGIAGWVLGVEGGNSRYFWYAGGSGYNTVTIGGRTIATSTRSATGVRLHQNGVDEGSVGVGTRNHSGDADILPMLGRQLGCVIATTNVDTPSRGQVETALSNYYSVALS